MRILHLAPGLAEGSGIAAYAHQYVAALQDAGLDVVRATPPWQPSTTNRFHEVRRYVRYVRDCVRHEQPDVVHTELGGGALAQYWAHSALTAMSVSTCATVHDAPRPVWWPWHVEGVRQNRWSAAALNRLGSLPAHRHQRLVLNRTDAVFVLSMRGVHSTQILYDLSPLRTHLLPYPLAQHDLASRPNDPPPPLVIAFHGFWYRGKGLETLLAAAARVHRSGRNIQLQLFGGPSRSAGQSDGERYRAAILRLAAQDGIGDRVAAPGWIEDAALLPALQRCHVVVLPYELSPGVGNLVSSSAAMMDAYRAGVPVLATEVRALPETVIHEQNGLLFPPRDVDALFQALCRLCDDHRFLERITDGARETSRTLRQGRTAAVAQRVYEGLIQGA